MDLDKIKELISKGEEKGLFFKVRDISFCVLRRTIKDDSIVYGVVFNTKEPTKKEVDSYLKEYSNEIAFIEKETKPKTIKVSDYDDITFEENKAEMVKMIKEIKQQMEGGEVPIKDGQKMIVDIRTKLNDKFGTTEKTDEQRIIVEAKYNAVCECGREIYIPNKR